MKNHMKNVSVYGISYETLIDVKPLRINFDKVDGYIRVYDGTRCLVLLEKYDFSYNMIRSFITVKSSIAYVIFDNQPKIKDDSYILNFHNVIIHIKSIWNKDQNHYYYNIFLEKCADQLPKNNNNEAFM